jgi:hypothetical protein
MRIFIILILALALAALFALFPEVADETLSIHAFGWLFETKQGPFILVLVLALGLYWLVRRIVLAMLAGPGQLWQVLKNGRKKRRETFLYDGLAEWVDMRGERGWKYFRKGKGFLPEWADALLSRLPMSPAEMPLPEDGDDDLLIALTARMASDPQGSPKPDPSVRQAHLDAWLKVHPGAPLALERKASLLQETENWDGLVSMLEEIWKRGGNSASRAAPKLASAYMQLSKTLAQTPGGQEKCLADLRKAHRLQPESGPVVLALGRALLGEGDASACRKLWLAHIERKDDAEIAVELMPLMHEDALKTYRRMEKKRESDITPAQALLRAGMAHAAGLDGLAAEQMEKLLAKNPSPQAWRTLGDWRLENGDGQAAAEAYQQALSLAISIPRSK